MKKTYILLVTVALLSFFASYSFAADIYAEYTITGVGNKPMLSKMYSRNGDLRTEVAMDIAGSKMNTITLMLKSKPNVMLVFNSATNTYTEVTGKATAKTKNIDVKIIGNEKVGNYNCTRVKMSAEGKSWDLWYTKDLPAIEFPITGNDATVSKKLVAELKSKGISGMPVKVALLKPNSTIATMTMLLTKFEQKTLSSSLFTIPKGYTKNNMAFDASKMKEMTSKERNELIKKMMKAQSQN